MSQIKKYLMLVCIMCFCVGVSANDGHSEQGYVLSSGGLVCTNNDYALCSHARCGCFDEDGNATDCEAYDPNKSSADNPAASWAQCDCPIVKNSGNLGSTYDANYASADLSCTQRKLGESSEFQLPPFVKGKKTEVYSTYSFGDSLPDSSFATKNAAKSLVCNSPGEAAGGSLFTDCLSMACYIPEGAEHAVCYCKNTSTETCQSVAWNTFGGDCSSGNCKTGTQADPQRIWSAACIDDTVGAIADVFAATRISGLAPNFKMLPAYCEAPSALQKSVESVGTDHD